MYRTLGTNHLRVKNNAVIEGDLVVKGTFDIGTITLPMGEDLELSEGLIANGDICIAATFTLKTDAIEPKVSGAITLNGDVVIANGETLSANTLQATSGSTITILDDILVDQISEGVSVNGVGVESLRVKGNEISAQNASPVEIGTTLGTGAVLLSKSGATTTVDGKLEVVEGGTWNTNDVCPINIGTDAFDDAINIGTGSGGTGRVVTVGATFGDASVVINTDAANGKDVIVNTNSFDINGRLTVTDGCTIDSGSFNIDIGTDLDNGVINIGTGTNFAGRIITIGNSNFGTSVLIQAGAKIVLDGDVEIDRIEPVTPAVDIGIGGNLILDTGKYVETGCIQGNFGGITNVKINDLLINTTGLPNTSINNISTVFKPLNFGNNVLTVSAVNIGNTSAITSIQGELHVFKNLTVTSPNSLFVNTIDAVSPATTIDVLATVAIDPLAVLQVDTIEPRTPALSRHGIYMNGGIRKKVRTLTTSTTLNKDDHIVIWDNATPSITRVLQLPAIDNGGDDEGYELFIRVADAKTISTYDTLQVAIGEDIIVDDAGGVLSQVALLIDETWHFIVTGQTWYAINHTTVAVATAP